MDIQKIRPKARLLRTGAAALLLLLVMIWLLGCMHGTEEAPAPAPESVMLVQGNAAASVQSSKPRPRADGKPHRIGVIDIDPYPYTGKLVYYVIEALWEQGWLELEALPFDKENIDMKVMINWLARQNTGRYIEFVADCNYYLAYDGEQAVKESLDAHIYVAQDIDMLWALGTWPATVASPYSSRVPVICYPLSAAQESGIVKTHEYSGMRNMWAQTDPERYKRQMKVFHEVLSFSKIGILYYDETMAAIGDYKESAAQLGVEVVTEAIPPLPADPMDVDILAFNTSIVYGAKRLLAQGIDAFLLTTDLIKNEETLQRLLGETDEAGVPVCVQSGDNFVQAGCLLMVDVYNGEELGYFVADTVAQVFNGAKPEELYQISVSTPYLVLNLDSFKKLEIQAPFELLMSSEKIYYNQS